MSVAGVIADELHRLDHVGVLDDHQIGRLPDSHVARRYEDGIRHSLSRHFPVEHAGRFVTDPPHVEFQAGKRRTHGFANHRIVASAEDRDFFGHGDLDLAANVQQVDRVDIAGSHIFRWDEASREAIRSDSARSVRPTVRMFCPQIGVR